MDGLLSFIVAVFSLYSVLFSVLKLLKTCMKSEDGHKITKNSGEVVGVDAGVWGTLKVMWQFKGTLWDDIAPYERAAGLHEKYGKLVRVYYNYLMTKQVVLLSDLKLTKQIFCSSSWLNRTLDSQKHYVHMLSFNKPIGILFGNGPHWKESRRIIVKLFKEHKLLDQVYVEDLYSSEIRLLLQDLHNRIDQDENNNGCAVFSPRHLFDEPVLNVIFKILFGRKISEDETKEGGLVDQLNYCNSTFTACLSSIEYFPILKYFPKLTFMGSVLKLCHTIYDIAAVEADKRRRIGTYADAPKDMIDSLLKEVDEHEGKNPNYFTFEALQVNVRDMVWAGGETIGSAMQHYILYMAMNTEAQNKVQAEIDQVIGTERWPSYDDRNSMIYTQATILESLRLGTPAPMSARTCTKECELGGLKIKEGTLILPNYYAIHHSSELWDEPKAFRPERFLNEKNELVNLDKAIPFAHGPRACPGELPGRVAMFMFSVLLMREFSWEVSERHPPPSLRNLKGLTRVPAPYFVKIRKRT